jgi:hypothetical protein
MVWKVVQFWIDENTKKKIFFAKNEELLKIFDKDNLLKCFGGNLDEIEPTINTFSKISLEEQEKVVLNNWKIHENAISLPVLPQAHSHPQNHSQSTPNIDQQPKTEENIKESKKELETKETKIESNLIKSNENKEAKENENYQVKIGGIKENENENKESNKIIEENDNSFKNNNNYIKEVEEDIERIEGNENINPPKEKKLEKQKNKKTIKSKNFSQKKINRVSLKNEYSPSQKKDLLKKVNSFKMSQFDSQKINIINKNNDDNKIDSVNPPTTTNNKTFVPKIRKNTQSVVVFAKFDDVELLELEEASSYSEEGKMDLNIFLKNDY